MNKVLRGDNLVLLSELESESVDLIYTDPPFATGRDFGDYVDKWRLDVEELEEFLYINSDIGDLVAFAANHAEKQIAPFLMFMYPRLVEMHRVLRPTGSLYLHCDSTASHYIKAMLDSLFGASNYRNEVIWQRTRGAKGTKTVRKFGNVVDSIFMYGKTNKHVFNAVYTPLSEEEMLKKFNRREINGRRYRTDRIELSNSMSGDGHHYTYRGYTPKKGWNFKKEVVEEMDKNGRVYWSKSHRPYRKYYMDEYPGVMANNLWTDINIAAGNERVGYATQKPLALADRIILAGSNEGDTVLDPFCGSGTTLIAAEKLNRKWIGIDINDVSDIIEKRLNYVHCSV